MKPKLRYAPLCAAVLACPVLADTYENATSSDLVSAAISAVERNDRRDLMDVMTTMRDREMFFFRAKTQTCEKVTFPREGIFGEFRAHAQTLKAFNAFLTVTKVESGECGCVSEAATQAEFSLAVFGVPLADVTEEHIPKANEYSSIHYYDSRNAWRAFSSEFCKVK